MRFSSSLGIAPLLLIGMILTACSAAQTSPTSTNISVNPPTSTVGIANSTAFPTPTAIPILTTPTHGQSLGEKPEVIAQDDIVVANGDYLFQITSAHLWPGIGADTPNTGEQFFVIEGYLYNYSNHEQAFYLQDFLLDLDDSDNVSPDNNLMGKLKEQPDSPNADYPGDNTARFQPFIVQAHAVRGTFIVYRIPENSSWITLKFRPAGHSTTSLEFIVTPAENNALYLLKTRVNGEPQYQIAMISFEDERVMGILSIRSERLENCSDIEIPTYFTRNSTTTEVQSTRLGTAIDLELESTGLSLPVLQALGRLLLPQVRAGITSNTGQASTSLELESSVEQQMTIPAWTILDKIERLESVEYQIVLEFEIGTASYAIPYIVEVQRPNIFYSLQPCEPTSP